MLLSLVILLAQCDNITVFGEATCWHWRTKEFRSSDVSIRWDFQTIDSNRFLTIPVVFNYQHKVLEEDVVVWGYFFWGASRPESWFVTMVYITHYIIDRYVH